MCTAPPCYWTASGREAAAAAVAPLGPTRSQVPPRGRRHGLGTLRKLHTPRGQAEVLKGRARCCPREV